MMPLPQQEVQQDSLAAKNVPLKDSVSHMTDTSPSLNTLAVRDSLPVHIRASRPVPVFVNNDTVSVCSRNSVADVTFYDSANLISGIGKFRTNKFPYLFISRNRNISEAKMAVLVRHLRAGDQIPPRPLHDDWILLIILAVTLLFAAVRRSSAGIWQGVERFFLFKRANDPSSADLGELFNWESTIKNLASFAVCGLFAYAVASFNNFIPRAISGMVFWIICFAAIIAAVTIRHLLSLVTGAASGERAVFSEYLLTIYQFYRFSALFIFVILILMSYTTVLPVRSYLTAGIVVFAVLYLVRVIRLLIIFINRNISLFYLILYLCALEFLPAGILMKYLSGLV